MSTNESGVDQFAWNVSYYSQVLLETTPVWVSKLFTNEKKKKFKQRKADLLALQRATPPFLCLYSSSTGAGKPLGGLYGWYCCCCACPPQL
jgi:hypothetical protein